MVATNKAKSTHAKTRVRELPKHRSFKLSKQRLKQHQPIPSAWQLSKDTFVAIKNHKRLFLGLAFIYALASFIFVQGVGSSFQIGEFKNNLSEVLGGDDDRVGTTLALFSYLIGSAGTSASEVAGAYQFGMILVVSLATIWGIRQIHAGESPGIRDVLYKGMYPLIPFIAVLAVIGLQLIPLLIGNLIYSTILQNGLAVSGLENALWLLLFILLALLSGYMLVSSLFGMYIVTLPDMRPIKALRSARELVLHRRLKIGLRMVALPLILSILVAIIFMPLLYIAPQVAEALFLVASSLGLIIVHIYMYLLYRSLI